MYVVMVATTYNDKAHLVIKVDQPTDHVNAVTLIQVASAILGGGGGGNPHIAQGGGPLPLLDEAIEAVRSHLRCHPCHPTYQQSNNGLTT